MRLLVLFLLVTTGAQAQVISESEQAISEDAALATTPKFLFKVGPGFSTYSSKDTTGLESKTGLFLAAEYEIPLSTNFSIDTGLNFMQKGTNVKFETTEVNLSMGYLVLPVLAKANFQISSARQISIGAGPYMAYAISKGVSINQDLPSAALDQTNKEWSDNTSNFDFGARLGINYEEALTSDLAFLVGFNYDLGFTNINTDPGNKDFSMNNRTLIGSVGLGIKL